jgi:cytochrome d ubiquinol oxidase subunit II
MDLQLTWFVLVGILIAGYAVLDGFDLGTGVLYPFLAKNEDERRALRAAIGPVWDGNEVWLITAGGALFAAFPPAYATTFAGFYPAIMLALFGLILRGVSLEFRHRDENWRTLWDGAFFVGSLLPALLFGVAVGNVVRGVPMNAAGDYTGTFLGLLNPFSLLVGVTGLAMFLAHGAAWTAVKTQGVLHDRATRARSLLHWAFVLLVVLTTVYTALAVSDRFHDSLGRVTGWLALILLVVGVVWARWEMLRKRDLGAFVASAVAIVGLVGLAAAGNYPDLVPARGSAAATSVTVSAAASSSLTLKVMLIITFIGMPLVLGYSVFVYRSFRGKVDVKEGEY